MNPRTNTPDRADPATGVTAVRLKRACNGCGRLLGDPDGRDVDERGRLTDVRAECPNCAPPAEPETPETGP